MNPSSKTLNPKTDKPSPQLTNVQGLSIAPRPPQPYSNFVHGGVNHYGPFHPHLIQQQQLQQQQRLQQFFLEERQLLLQNQWKHQQGFQQQQSLRQQHINAIAQQQQLSFDEWRNLHSLDEAFFEQQLLELVNSNAQRQNHWLVENEQRHISWFMEWQKQLAKGTSAKKSLLDKISKKAKKTKNQTRRSDTASPLPYPVVAKKKDVVSKDQGTKKHAKTKSRLREKESNNVRQKSVTFSSTLASKKASEMSLAREAKKMKAAKKDPPIATESDIISISSSSLSSAIESEKAHPAVPSSSSKKELTRENSSVSPFHEKSSRNHISYESGSLMPSVVVQNDASHDEGYDSGWSNGSLLF